MRRFLFPLAALAMLGSADAAPPEPREATPSGVAVVGDGRTAADPAVPGSAGWGDSLAMMLRPGVAVTNLARSGTTLAGFLAEDGLGAALAARPAFVVIGFGQGEADADGEVGAFATNLLRVVAAVRARGATPLLVTPPLLRTIDPITGKPARVPAADAQPFADAAARVARASGAELLDLRAQMRANYEEIGDRANWFLHPPLDAAREPVSRVRSGKKHAAPSPRHPAYFSASGADSLAHWLANLLSRGASPLAALLRPEDGPPSADYELVWRDEFDGTQWDTNSWSCRSPGPRKDGINDPDCIRLDGQGHLVVDIKQVGDQFHTGLFSTRGRREWQYGYFECRMTLARGLGFWNNFWLTTDTISAAQRDPARVDDTRRNGTEIDIVEYLLKQGDVVHLNLHWNGYGELHRSSPNDVFVPDLRRQEWHVFGAEWRTDGYTFYVDGRRAWQTSDAPSDVPEYIVMGAEIAKWVGDIRQARLPQQVAFDWVRVWQRKP